MTNTDTTAATTFKAHGELTETADGLSVHIIWDSPAVDRTDVGGWGLGLRHRALAERLIRAINAGKAYRNPRLATDVNGKTYVQADHTILGRHMNADLTRLGF